MLICRLVLSKCVYDSITVTGPIFYHVKMHDIIRHYAKIFCNVWFTYGINYLWNLRHWCLFTYGIRDIDVFDHVSQSWGVRLLFISLCPVFFPGWRRYQWPPLTGILCWMEPGLSTMHEHDVSYLGDLSHVLATLNIIPVNKCIKEFSMYQNRTRGFSYVKLSLYAP